LELQIHTAGRANTSANLHLYDSEQQEIVSTSNLLSRIELPAGPMHKWRVVIPPQILNVGEYRCSLVIAEIGLAIHEQLDHVLGFTVVDTAFPGPGEASSWRGYCSPKLPQWSQST